MRKFTTISDLMENPDIYTPISQEVETNFYSFMEDVERRSVEEEQNAQDSASKMFLSK